MQQDGPEQAVVYVAMLLMSSSGAQADSLSRMAAWNPWRHGRASTSPFGLFGLQPLDRREPTWCSGKNITDVVVAQRDGRNRGELRRAAMVECVGVDGEKRTDPVE
jgi:hypothetical protein